MTIDPWILTFSAVTVFATIFMGFWSARKSKTASDFFVAGRSVSVGWNASAISGEYLSAASFMGVAGMVMSSGYDALWYPVCYACGYLFLLLFIAGPLRRFGAYTIPDFAEGRFDSPLFRKIAVVFVLFIGFFYTMPQMKGAGTTLAYIFPGLPYWAGVVLVGAVITLNVALGGMKGITLVQAFQYWAKMFAISVPIFVLMAVYGHYGKQLGRNGSQGDPVSVLPFHSAQEIGKAIPGAIISSSKSESGLNWSNGFTDMGTAKRLVMEKLGLTSPYLGVATNFDWLELRDAYSHFSGKTVCYLDGLKPEAGFSFDERAFVTSRSALAGLENILRKGGIEVFQLNRTQAFFLDQKQLGIVAKIAPGLQPNRQELPAKAPADSTWLSPFGPLTTKAAKAAAAVHAEAAESLEPPLPGDGRVRIDPTKFPLDFQQEVVSQSFPGPQGELKNTAARWGLLRISHTLPVPNCDTTMAIGLYAAFRKGLNAHFTNYVENAVLQKRFTRLDTSKVPIPPVPMNARTFSRYVEQVFQTNGLTLVHISRDAVALVLTKELSRYSLEMSGGSNAREDWLAKHEKPLALLYTYSLIIALVCGTAGLPHILVRFYTNPDGVAAKRTTMWVMILIGIFYVFPPVFGVMGRNLMPQLYEGVGAKGTDKVVLELPRILNSHSPTDSLTHSQGGDVSGKVGEPVSGKRIPWGSILSGVTCAGAFAAFMSTFSGLLVSMTGALAHDVYGRMLRPKSTQEQRLRAFKVCTVIIGGIAIVLGCFVEPLEINFMVGQAFAIAAASYFPLLFMSVWWRGMTMRGAATGMLTGGLCALAAVTLTNCSNLALDKGPMGKLFSGFAPMNEFWAHHPLLRILCEQPAIWTVPLAIGLMIVVSKRTQKEVPGDVRMKMLVLHAPEKLGLKQEYIQEHQPGH